MMYWVYVLKYWLQSITLLKLDTSHLTNCKYYPLKFLLQEAITSSMYAFLYNLTVLSVIPVFMEVPVQILVLVFCITFRSLLLLSLYC
jgi:hypothetical protein